MALADEPPVPPFKLPPLPLRLREGQRVELLARPDVVSVRLRAAAHADHQGAEIEAKNERVWRVFNMTVEQLDRLTLLAKLTLPVTLTTEDQVVILAALEFMHRLFREKPEAFLSDCCRLAKCTRHLEDGTRVDWIPPHECKGAPDG